MPWERPARTSRRGRSSTPSPAQSARQVQFTNHDRPCFIQRPPRARTLACQTHKRTHVCYADVRLMRMMFTYKWVGDGSTSFATQSQKHCSGKTTGSSYSSLSAAETACTSSQACSGVYDAACDGQAPYYMCKAGVTLSTSSSSCVYTKTKGTHVL